MGTPRIVYAGRTIDLGYLSTYLPSPSLVASTARSDSGASRKIVTGAYDHVTFSVEGFSDRALYLALRAWWDYAATGAPWAFAVDSAKMTSTTLAQAANYDSDTLQLAAGGGAGISAGDALRVIDAADPTVREIVVVSGVIGDVVHCSDLLQDFSSGSIVRHLEYHPALELLDESCPVQEGDGLIYTLSAEAREVAS